MLLGENRVAGVQAAGQSKRGWVHHGIGAVVQVGAAVVGLWIFLKLAVVVDILGAKKMDEESFLIPLVLGGSALLMVALLSYAIVVGVFKLLGHVKYVSYWYLVVAGFIQGLALFPCLAAARFFLVGPAPAVGRHIQGGWEAGGVVGVLLLASLVVAALPPLLWVLFLRVCKSKSHKAQ